jgi:hypothetical protein
MLTDTEKAAAYHQLPEMLNDRIALEKYFRSEDRNSGVIQSVRADAYGCIVCLIVRFGALPDLPIFGPVSRKG